MSKRAGRSVRRRLREMEALYEMAVRDLREQGVARTREMARRIRAEEELDRWRPTIAKSEDHEKLTYAFHVSKDAALRWSGDPRHMFRHAVEAAEQAFAIRVRHLQGERERLGPMGSLGCDRGKL
jgi:hypothetical protein